MRNNQVKNNSNNMKYLLKPQTTMTTLSCTCTKGLVGYSHQGPQASNSVAWYPVRTVTPTRWAESPAICVLRRCSGATHQTSRSNGLEYRQKTETNPRQINYPNNPAWCFQETRRGRQEGQTGQCDEAQGRGIQRRPWIRIYRNSGESWESRNEESLGKTERFRMRVSS